MSIDVLSGNAIANPGMVSMPVEEPTGMPAQPSAGQDALSNLPTAAVAPLSPLPTTPAPPSPGQSALSGGGIDGKGTFAQQLAQHADALGVPAGPGGWAKSLVGAAQRTLAGMDIGKIPEGGGALDGIAKVMANRQQMDMADRERKDKLKQQDVLNKRADRQDAREDERNKSYMATEALQRTMTAKTISQGDLKDLELGKEMGEQAMKPLMTGAHPTQRLQSGLTSDQAAQLVQDKKLDPLQHHFFQDGVIPVEGQKDLYGNQKYQATFSVFGDTPDVTLDKENAARFSKYSGQAFKEGDHLTGIVYGQLDSQSQSAQVAEHQALDEAAAAGIKTTKLAQEVAKNKMVSSGDWTMAMQKDGVNGDPRKAMQFMTTDPKMKAKYGNPADVAMSIYGGPEGWEKVVDSRKKNDLEDSKIAAANYAMGIDAAIDGLKPGANGEPPKMGKAYVAELQEKEPAKAALLQSIYNGQEERSPRSLQDKNGNPTPLAIQLHRAYPPDKDGNGGFDITRVQNFAKVRKDYSSPNGTGGQIRAYGTALNHMRRLYDNATWMSQLDPASDDYRKRDVDERLLANEIAGAITQHGKPAEAEIDKIYQGLISKTGPGGLKQRVQEYEQLMSGKFSEVKQTWESAAPNDDYHPPMPNMSPEALNNAEYVRSGGKVDKNKNPAAGEAAGKVTTVVTPSNTTHVFPNEAAKNRYDQLVRDAKAKQIADRSKAAAIQNIQQNGQPTGVPGSFQPGVHND